jgi:hypothetical protein
MVEARFPFLDFRILRFVLGLDCVEILSDFNMERGKGDKVSGVLTVAAAERSCF